MKRLEFKASRVMPEAFANPPDGITVIDSGERTAGMTAEVITWANFAITIASGVTIKVASDFIYNAIRKGSKMPPEGITINQTYIRFEHGEIAEFINTKITDTHDES